MSKILVTGGAGYIGSHTVLVLLEQGFDVVVFDNLSNASEEALNRVTAITGKPVEFIQGDVNDSAHLKQVFEQHDIAAVIHFAALKAVGESVAQPLRYYQNNVQGTVNLLSVMREMGVNNFIFSSSATVYGEDAEPPLKESLGLGRPTNPYGQSKAMVEQIIQDLAVADDQFKAVSLRYFNPVGAHISGRIGEDPKGIPNNLLPYVAQVAVGRRDYLSVYGNDYDTADGTGERDYIHVMDLAQGHLAALNWLTENQRFTGVEVFNLGTGKGNSVLEIISAFEQASGVDIPYRIVARRPGDIAANWADAEKAKAVLGWQTNIALSQMMEDTWRWQSANPNGYES